MASVERPVIYTPTSADPNQRLLYVASLFVGTHEEGGENRGAWVEEFQKAVDGKAQGEPYCVGFIWYCLTTVEKDIGKLSPLFRTEGARVLWNKSPKLCRIAVPVPGCIVVWGHKGAASGHVGVVESVSGTQLHTIEANTGAGAGVVREGDGVYRRTRSMTPSGSMIILGYLNPFA